MGGLIILVPATVNDLNVKRYDDPARWHIRVGWLDINGNQMGKVLKYTGSAVVSWHRANDGRAVKAPINPGEKYS